MIQEIDVCGSVHIRGKFSTYSDWVPQIQLLQHPAVTTGIVHGGTGGVTETLYIMECLS